ncbi:MAG: RNA polymerase sigma factor [Planctomycetia bacterium]|nr:RNA polymerase sigma factor [Planctomycetia bacterium]
MTSRPSSQFEDAIQNDEMLMERFCQTGEERFLEGIIRRYEYELYHYLKRFLGDAQLAEDAFQLTFMQVYLKSAQFEVGRKVRPWLYMVATNQAIDLQRRNKRHRHASLEKTVVGLSEELDGISLLEILPGEFASPESQLERQEQSQWVGELVNQLPEPLRQVVILIYYEGIKYREVAEILQIPVGTVKSRLHTAIKRLGLMIRGIEDV